MSKLVNTGKRKVIKQPSRLSVVRIRSNGLVPCMKRQGNRYPTHQLNTIGNTLFDGVRTRLTKRDLESECPRLFKDADIDLIISHVTAADASKDQIHQQMIDQMQFVKDEYGIDGLALRDNPRMTLTFSKLSKPPALRIRRKK